MNLSTLFGFLAAAAVFFAAIFTSSDNFFFFLNAHAILIVFGGTAAATLICFPIGLIMNLLKVFIKGCSVKPVQTIIRSSMISSALQMHTTEVTKNFRKRLKK